MEQTRRQKLRWRIWEPMKFKLAKKGLWPSDWVPDVLRSRVTRGRAVAAAAVLVVVVVFALLNSRLEWGIEWGNVSGWFTGIMSAAVVITLAVVNHRRETRAERMAAELNASRVILRIEPVAKVPSYWRIVVRNRTGGPIFKLKFEAMHAVEPARPYLNVDGKQLDERPDNSEFSLEDGEDHAIVFEPEDPGLVHRANLFPRITFVDPNGYKFLSVYPSRQTIETGTVTLWRLLGRHEEPRRFIFVPPEPPPTDSPAAPPPSNVRLDTQGSTVDGVEQ